MQKLAGEIMVLEQPGRAAYKKKEESYRMAEANKAFAHHWLRQAPKGSPGPGGGVRGGGCPRSPHGTEGREKKKSGGE